MTIKTKKIDSIRLKAISRFHVADEADIADRKVALTVAHRHRGELLAHIAYLEQRLAAIENMAREQRKSWERSSVKNHLGHVQRAAIHALILDNKEMK